MDIQNLQRVFTKFVSDNSPTILAGLASGGVAFTAILAVKVTPEVNRRRAEATAELKGLETLRGKAKLFAFIYKPYLPAVSVGAASIACIIGGTAISQRRNAALASIYTLTEKAFTEYKGKVAETIGAKKEESVRAAIAEEHIRKEPPSNSLIIGDGQVTCYDTLTGRYFSSDMEALRKAQNDINQKTINEMYASQNDFYQLVGLPLVGYGEEVGWRTDNMLELEFSSILSEDGKPCLAIDYRLQPIRGYYKEG